MAVSTIRRRVGRARAYGPRGAPALRFIPKPARAPWPKWCTSRSGRIRWRIDGDQRSNSVTLIKNVGTVQTQSVQLWLNKTAAELGYSNQIPIPLTPIVPNDHAVFSGYVEPFDTYAD